MRIVRREIGGGIASRAPNRGPRVLVDDGARCVRGSVSPIGAAGEQRRAARALRHRELARGGQCDLLAASADPGGALHGDGRLSPPKEAALHWTIGQWRGPGATIAY